MLAYKLSTPIRPFDIEEFGIPKEEFLASLKETFHTLPADDYLLRQRHVEILKAINPYSKGKEVELAYNQYYIGQKSLDSLLDLLKSNREEIKSVLKSVQPTRFRGSACFLEDSPSTQVGSLSRIPNTGFVQEHALTVEEADFRANARTFIELDNSLFTEEYRQILKGILAMAKEQIGKSCKLKVTVHHTKVCTTPSFLGSNSPEGIHQDGMDYIVSALVVERKNVLGGRSTIYAEDKVSRILETTLMPGQGLFQPDYGSSLWHSVSPIQPQGDLEGFRSTIGIDIEVVE